MSSAPSGAVGLVTDEMAEEAIGEICGALSPVLVPPRSESRRCERNLAGPEEDCGGHVTYVPCGSPADWELVERNGSTWWACDEHCKEALRDNGEWVAA